MRGPLLLAVALAAAGCGGVRKCKGGTMLVTVALEGPAAGADAVEVDALVEGGDHLTGRFAFDSASRGGTVEIQFPSGYPEGRPVTVRVTALKGAAPLSSGRAVITAEPGCTAGAVTVGTGDDGCTPAVSRCSDDRKRVLTCRADGSGFDEAECAFGCSAGVQPACLHLSPSGSVARSDYAMLTTPTTITADTVFDTDTGAITGGLTRDAGGAVDNNVFFRSVAQPGSTVRVGAFGFGGLTINPGVTLTVVGKSPIALVSSGPVEIGGTINVQGDCITPSAGAGAGGKLDVNNGDGLGVRGGRAGAGVLDAASGGGGGGHGTTGGNGGSGVMSAGGAGGQPFGDLTAEPLTLVGGSGGGAGGGGLNAGAGGHGGGAVQIAADGALTVRGTIQASGCGGQGGGAQAGGGGGGAGGVILLEAATITLGQTAILVANGGGGGGADQGDPGQHGLAQAARAAGGIGRNAGTAGGPGGAAGLPEGAGGVSVSGAQRTGGGGGGAAGRVALKTQSGALVNEGATISPSPSDRSPSGQPLHTTGLATFE